MLKALSASFWWAPVLSIFILYGAHLSLGANTNALAMILVIASYGLCLTVLLFTPQVKTAFGHPALVITALFFALTLLMLALQLGPHLPGGAHPFWAWLTEKGGITLDRDATIRELLKLTALGAIFITGIAIGIRRQQASVFFRLFMVAGLAYAIWTFITHFIALGATENDNLRQSFRLTAGFGSANSAATVFGSLSVLSLAAIIRSAKKSASRHVNKAIFLERLLRYSSLPLVALLLCMTVLLLTASRGGILASLFALLVFGLWESLNTTPKDKSAGRPFSMIMLSLLAISFVFLISSDLFINRLETDVLATDVRLETFAPHWQAFLASPLSGYGLGSFYTVNGLLMNVQNLRVLHDIGALHNVYLQWLEEGGALASALMFGTLVLINWQILQGVRARMRMRTWLRAVLCISLLIVLHGTVDYGLQVPSIATMWALLLGVGFGISVAKGR